MPERKLGISRLIRDPIPRFDLRTPQGQASFSQYRNTLLGLRGQVRGRALQQLSAKIGKANLMAVKGTKAPVRETGKTIPGVLRKRFQQIAGEIYPTRAQHPAVTRGIERATQFESQKRIASRLLPKKVAQDIVRDVAKKGIVTTEKLGVFADRATLNSINEAVAKHTTKAGLLKDRPGLVNKISAVFRRRTTSPLLGFEETTPRTGLAKSLLPALLGALATVATSPVEAQAEEISPEFRRLFALPRRGATGTF